MLTQLSTGIWMKNYQYCDQCKNLHIYKFFGNCSFICLYCHSFFSSKDMNHIENCNDCKERREYISFFQNKKFPIDFESKLYGVKQRAIDSGQLYSNV
jgi:hypothetical protein